MRRFENNRVYFLVGYRLIPLYGGPPLKIFACSTSLAAGRRPKFPPPADQGNRRLPDFNRRRPPHPPARREH
jgi:hypothetical protein